MENLQYFDCFVQVGKFGYKHREHKWSVGHTLGEMERCGIAGALVTHGMAKSHSPLYGNRLLERELAGNPRLFGCWTILPAQLGDFPSADEWLPLMAEQQIRAVKMYPATHQFHPDERTMGQAFGALETARLPLFVEAAEISFPQLEEVLRRYAGLPVVLQGLSWSQERKLFPLMDAFPNLHVELSTLQGNRFVEIAYARYGAERLLFGSGMPAKSPGAARAFIDYARIPDDAKRLIAGGNLSRLLGGLAPPPAAMPDQDEVTYLASRGQPIAIPVLDSHTHLIEEGGNTGSGLPMLFGGIADMVDMYDSLGIRKMCVAPWVGINGGDAETGNLVAERTVRQYPGKVEAFALIDPNYTPDVERAARVLHHEQKFRGMKPYFYLSHTPYTAPVYAPWWRIGNELRLFALVDPGLLGDGDYVAQIEELAATYPEVNFFMDHAGRTFEIAELYAQTAKKYGNVTLQLTYTSVTLGVIEYLVREVGADKILFGTDSPMRDPRPQVGWLAYADLSLEDKKKIFGGNYQRILNRCLI